jgi:hypothetical protein
MTLKNPKQLHHQKIRCKFSHWVPETFFGRLHTKIIVENFRLFDTAEKMFSSYAPRLITIYFVIKFFQALKYHKQQDAE